MAGREVYEFAGFTLEVAERRLLKGQQTVSLAPRAFDLLVVLVRQAPARDQAGSAGSCVGRHVDEGILSVHVSNLRKALGDRDTARRFNETVPQSAIDSAPR